MGVNLTFEKEFFIKDAIWRFYFVVMAVLIETLRKNIIFSGIIGLFLGTLQKIAYNRA